MVASVRQDKRKRFAKPTRLVYGTPVVAVITAEDGGFAEAVIRHMATNGEQRNSHLVRFDAKWDEASMSGTVSLKRPGTSDYVVVLKVGMGGDLHLKNDRKGYSLKPKNEEGVLTIHIPQRPSDLARYAFGILAMVARGKGWTDRKGNVHDEPWN